VGSRCHGSDLSCHDAGVESSSYGIVNKVILVGNLGRDAELRYTPGGAAVAKFSLATTEVWNDKAASARNAPSGTTSTLWGKQAESLSEYLVKGKQVYVEGACRPTSTPTRRQQAKSTKVRCDASCCSAAAAAAAARRRRSERATTWAAAPGAEPSRNRSPTTTFRSERWLVMVSSGLVMSESQLA
jgi:single stranded DNA-binding protein